MSEATESRTSARGRELALRLMADEVLAKRAATGDSDAVAVLYQRHHSALYRYCRSILNNPDDALDALQETMAKAIRGLAARGGDVPLKPWLFRIAHNESINLLRRRRPVIDLSDAIASTDDDLAHSTQTRERLRQLVVDLQELPERQRGALVMRELNDLSFEEIGAAFGTTAAGAKQTVYEARMALHERSQGRDMNCDDVRVRISAADRRVLRGRRVRAHLAACAPCRAFADAIPARQASLAALAPPPAAGVAGGLLEQLLGSEGGRAAVEGGVFAPLAGSAGHAVSGIGATKAAIAAAIAISTGAASVVTVKAGDDPRAPAPVAPASTAGVPERHGAERAKREPNVRLASAERRRRVAAKRKAARKREQAAAVEARSSPASVDSGGVTDGGTGTGTGAGTGAGTGTGTGAESGGSGSPGGGGGGGLPLEVPKVEVPVDVPEVEAPAVPEVELPKVDPPKLPLP